MMVVNDAPFFLSHRLPIALAARTAGYDVHVATPEHPRRTEIEQQGLSFHPFPLTRSSASPGSELGSIRSLMALYRNVRPDLVHHVTHKPVLYGSIAARLTKVPAVVNAISGLGYAFIATGWKAGLRRRLMLSAYRAAFSHPNCRAIFQNPEDVALFRDAGVLSPGQYILIPGSGVELDRFVPTPEPPGPPLIVLGSRMLWDKGIGEFVEAARVLRSRGIVFRAALVGEPDPGNPRSLTESQLRAWNDEGIVEWWGRRSDMATVFASCSIACLPSTYREGVPKVLLEAAACGRPIVTTDAPGCRVVARPEDNGLLVPPGDAASLASALERLLLDAPLRARMGARSRAIAEAEFGIQSVVDATLALYSSLHA
jgi:glycosyltransferase involved in cell wall biosynthesis